NPQRLRAAARRTCERAAGLPGRVVARRCSIREPATVVDEGKRSMGAGARERVEREQVTPHDRQTPYWQPKRASMALRYRRIASLSAPAGSVLAAFSAACRTRQIVLTGIEPSFALRVADEARPIARTVAIITAALKERRRLNM